MRYLWVAAIGAAIVGGPVGAKPAPQPVPIPSEFPTTLPPPAPPIAYPVAPPPPPPSYYGRPATPKGNPGYWATQNDYPTAALRDEISGVTRFRATIGTDGRVSQCDVTQSSGSALLDTTTCSLIARRARFNPAVDAEGNPAVGSYSTAVRWIIPVDLPPEPGTSTSDFIVDSEGKLSNCRVKSADGEAYTGSEACPDDQMDGSYKDTAGKPVSRRVSVRYEVVLSNAPTVLGPRPPAPRVWRGTDVLPIAGTRVTEIIVETDGSVSDCRIVKLTGPIAAKVELGTNDCPKRYERGYAAANGELVRTLVRMTETTMISPVGKSR